VPGVPFSGEYAYMTLYAKDHELLDELQIAVRVTSYNVQAKARAINHDKGEEDVAAAEVDIQDDDSLNEYLAQEKLREGTKPRNPKQDMLSFKQEVEKKMDMLMTDDDEWDIYRGQMNIKIKNRYVKDAQPGMQV